MAELIGGGTVATLCSRFLALPGLFLTNEVFPNNTARTWQQDIPGTGDEILPYYLDLTGRPPHFPYGYPVEPDVRL